MLRDSCLQSVRISIHALREEGDPRERLQPSTPTTFLSTPSARRATDIIQDYVLEGKFLSTPSARRATAGIPPSMRVSEISIHALREEGDAGTGRSRK